MTISFECSGCGKAYNLKDEAAGKRLRCKRCGNVIEVPEPELEVLDDDDDDLFDGIDEFERKAPAYKGDEFGSSLPPASRRARSAPKPVRGAKKKSAGSRSHDDAELNFNRLTIGLLIGGAMLMFLGLQESRLAGAAKSTPQKLSVSSLLQNGPGSNAHLMLTGGELSDQFVFESTTNAAPYKQVWVPAVPADGEGGGAIKLIVRSGQCKTDADILNMDRQLQTSGLQGMIINKIARLGGEERKLLEESYPSADFDTCYIFQVGRKPAGTGKVMATMFGGGALALVGMALLLGGYLSRPEGMMAMGAAGVLVVGLGGYFSFAGGGADANAAQVAENDAGADAPEDNAGGEAAGDAGADSAAPVQVAEASGNAGLGNSGDPEINLADFSPPKRPPTGGPSRPGQDSEQKRIVPSSGIPVTSSTPITPGMSLQAKWGGQWYEVRVLEVLPGDKLKIHWIGWGDVWDEEKSRSELQLAKGGTPPGSNAGSANAQMAQAARPAQEVAQAKGGFRPLDSSVSSVASGPPAGWEVQPDPPSVPVAAGPPEKLSPIRLGNGDVVLPELPSDFAAIGDNSSEREAREVWNLREGRKVGVIKGVRLSSEKKALSPDGKYFAGKTAGANAGLMVWDIEAEKPLGSLPLDSITGFIKMLTFAGNKRLVAGGYDQKLTIWRIPSGDLEHHLEMPKVANMGSVAFSPGGRFLAIMHDFNKNVTVFDLETGKQAGTTTNPGGISGDGMAFSPDGQELAAVCSDHKGTTIQVWNVSTGALSQTLDLGEVVKAIGSPEFKYKGPAIAWFPEKDRWLLYGHAVVDRKVGKRVWSVPGNTQPLVQIGPHAILGRGHLAVLGGAHRNQALGIVELSDEVMAKAAAVVESGGKLADAALPPLTDSDWSQAQPAATEGRVAWSVTADPAPRPAGALMKRPISISTRGRQIGGAAMSAGTSPRLVVQASPGTGGAQPAASSGGTTELITYDLADSNELKSSEIPYVGHLLAVSPNGKQAVVRLFDGLSRLDVWNLEEGAHGFGWRPYSNEPEADDNTARFLAGLSNTPNFMDHVANIGRNNKQIILGAAFIDDSHVLTLNTGQKLVVWELPACKALYTVEGVSKGGISPGGKYIAVFRNETVQLLDAVTGEKRGELQIGGQGDALAFHPDGTRLAACISNKAGYWMNVWNVADGKLMTEFPLPKSAKNSLKWCGDGHLLIDHSGLVDLKRELLVWSFDVPGGQHLPQTPDGRHWYVAATSNTGADAKVMAVELPDRELVAQLDRLKPQRKCVVEPGSKVTLQINLAANSTKPSLAADVTKSLTEQFTQNGVTVTGGQPVVFKVTSTEKPTGQNVEYRKIGLGGGGSTTVAVVRSTMTVEVLKGGQKVWSRESHVDNAGFGFEHIKQGESIQSHLTKEMHEGVAKYLMAIVPPQYIFEESTSGGFGRSQLTAAGVVHR